MKSLVLLTVLMASSVAGIASYVPSVQAFEATSQNLISSSITPNRSIGDAKSRFIIAQSAPLTGEQEDTVRRKSYMKTKITISNLGGGNGRIDGTTRTWTDVRLAGFVGGVDVALLDANKNILYVTPLQDYGVNGKWLGGSDRTDRWNESIPAGVVDKVKGYLILHRTTPRSISLGNLRDYGQEIIRLYKSLE
jgi:hypothetical protein